IPQAPAPNRITIHVIDRSKLFIRSAFLSAARDEKPATDFRIAFLSHSNFASLSHLYNMSTPFFTLTSLITMISKDSSQRIGHPRRDILQRFTVGEAHQVGSREPARE